MDSKDADGGLDEEGWARREALKGDIETIMNMEVTSWRQKAR